MHMTSSGPTSQQGGRAPQVSVVVPVYNGAETIGRALESIIDAQTFDDYEIIVVDDGSTDQTRAILEQYGDRVLLVEQPNSGQAAARNNGVRHSSGEFVAFLDADDQFLPRRLELTVAALIADPDAVLVYSDMIVVNEAGEEFRRSHISPETAHAPTMDEMLTRIWPIMPSTVLMRRAAFDRTGGFCEQLRGPEDIHFWLLVREQGHFIYLPDRLARYTFDQLYPKVLNRVGPGAMVDLIRARYGSRGEPFVQAFISHRVRMIANAGVIEMSRGNMEGARRCFIRVLSYDRLHAKSYLRIARTFLPAPIRRALGGKAARGARSLD
jgi:glycosyltransferase involved in cell wall biosynthesis